MAMFLAATKRVALDGVIFWPQLKEWLWMGHFLAATKRVALDGVIF